MTIGREVGVRGRDGQTGKLFSYVSPEGLVPPDHPLRAIKRLVDAALGRLSADFEALYARTGRPSIAPEKLMALAEIWEGWRGEGGEMIRSFAVVTTDANQIMAQVHNRMRVIREDPVWPVWLGEREGDPTSLLRPARDDVLRLWPECRMQPQEHL